MFGTSSYEIKNMLLGKEKTNANKSKQVKK